MTDEELIEQELIRCNKCGYCLSTCPTYNVDFSEAQAARGRLVLLQALQDGELLLSQGTERPEATQVHELAEAVSGCLLCGACTEACFSAIRTDELMVLARAGMPGGPPKGVRLLTHHFLLRPERLTAVMRLAGVGRRTGMVRLLRRLSPTLELAEKLVEPAPREFLRDRLRKIGFHPEGRSGTWVLPRDPRALTVGPRVAYFIGCGTNYQLPEPGEAAMRLLARAGCEVVVGPHVCCGLPPYSYGDLVSARDLARRNLELLGGLGADFLVTECGSCSRFLKRYPELLEGEPTLAQQAKALGEHVRDCIELLATLPLPEPVNPPPEIVTYHDPCHLGRGQGVTVEPRQLLREAAGAKLVELPEANWCCGGAGTYNLAHPERSESILERKMKNIESTGAKIVATACPACILQLRHGVRMSGNRAVVRHVAEIVAAAQGLMPACVEEGE